MQSSVSELDSLPRSERHRALARLDLSRKDLGDLFLLGLPKSDIAFLIRSRQHLFWALDALLNSDNDIDLQIEVVSAQVVASHWKKGSNQDAIADRLVGLGGDSYASNFSTMLDRMSYSARKAFAQAARRGNWHSPLKERETHVIESYLSDAAGEPATFASRATLVCLVSGTGLRHLLQNALLPTCLKTISPRSWAKLVQDHYDVVAEWALQLDSKTAMSTLDVANQRVLPLLCKHASSGSSTLGHQVCETLINREESGRGSRVLDLQLPHVFSAMATIGWRPRQLHRRRLRGGQATAARASALHLLARFIAVFDRETPSTYGGVQSRAVAETISPCEATDAIEFMRGLRTEGEEAITRKLLQALVEPNWWDRARLISIPATVLRRFSTSTRHTLLARFMSNLQHEVVSPYATLSVDAQALLLLEREHALKLLTELGSASVRMRIVSSRIQDSSNRIQCAVHHSCSTSWFWDISGEPHGKIIKLDFLYAALGIPEAIPRALEYIRKLQPSTGNERGDIALASWYFSTVQQDANEEQMVGALQRLLQACRLDAKARETIWMNMSLFDDALANHLIAIPDGVGDRCCDLLREYLEFRSSTLDFSTAEVELVLSPVVRVLLQRLRRVSGKGREVSIHAPLRVIAWARSVVPEWKPAQTEALVILSEEMDNLPRLGPYLDEVANAWAGTGLTRLLSLYGRKCYINLSQHAPRYTQAIESIIRDEDDDYVQHALLITLRYQGSAAAQAARFADLWEIEALQTHLINICKQDDALRRLGQAHLRTVALPSNEESFYAWIEARMVKAASAAEHRIALAALLPNGASLLFRTTQGDALPSAMGQVTSHSHPLRYRWHKFLQKLFHWGSVTPQEVLPLHDGVSSSSSPGNCAPLLLLAIARSPEPALAWKVGFPDLASPKDQNHGNLRTALLHVSPFRRATAARTRAWLKDMCGLLRAASPPRVSIATACQDVVAHSGVYTSDDILAVSSLAIERSGHIDVAAQALQSVVEVAAQGSRAALSLLHQFVYQRPPSVAPHPSVGASLAQERSQEYQIRLRRIIIQACIRLSASMAGSSSITALRDIVVPTLQSMTDQEVAQTLPPAITVPFLVLAACSAADDAAEELFSRMLQATRVADEEAAANAARNPGTWVGYDVTSMLIERIGQTAEHLSRGASQPADRLFDFLVSLINHPSRPSTKETAFKTLTRCANAQAWVDDLVRALSEEAERADPISHLDTLLLATRLQWISEEPRASAFLFSLDRLVRVMRHTEAVATVLLLHSPYHLEDKDEHKVDIIALVEGVLDEVSSNDAVLQPLATQQAICWLVEAYRRLPGRVRRFIEERATDHQTQTVCRMMWACALLRLDAERR